MCLCQTKFFFFQRDRGLIGLCGLCGHVEFERDKAIKGKWLREEGTNNECVLIHWVSPLHSEF